MNIKETLEKKLGYAISDQALNFAIKQFKTNSEIIYKDREMDTKEALNELRLDVEFYNKHTRGF